jgi:hypothetical protein
MASGAHRKTAHGAVHKSFRIPLAAMAFQVRLGIDIVELVTLRASGTDKGIPILQVRQQRPQQTIVIQLPEIPIVVAVRRENLLLVRVMGQERQASRRTGDVLQRVDQGHDFGHKLSLGHFIPGYP